MFVILSFMNTLQLTVTDKNGTDQLCPRMQLFPSKHFTGRQFNSFLPKYLLQICDLVYLYPYRVIYNYCCRRLFAFEEYNNFRKDFITVMYITIIYHDTIAIHYLHQLRRLGDKLFFIDFIFLYFLSILCYILLQCCINLCFVFSTFLNLFYYFYQM